MQESDTLRDELTRRGLRFNMLRESFEAHERSIQQMVSDLTEAGIEVDIIKAPELVGAEPVRDRGRLQRHGRVAGQRIVRHQPGAEHRRDQDQHQQAERGERSTAETGRGRSDDRKHAAD